MEPFPQLAALGAMIERLTSDSRRCAPGAAFFAYPGEKADGRAHIPDALARGASAVLWESGDRFAWRDEWTVPNVGVEPGTFSVTCVPRVSSGGICGVPSEFVRCGLKGPSD